MGATGAVPGGGGGVPTVDFGGSAAAGGAGSFSGFSMFMAMDVSRVRTTTVP
jgi:hypothetical protein